MNAGIGLPGTALILSPFISTLKRSLLAFVNNAIFNLPSISKQARFPEANAHLKFQNYYKKIQKNKTCIKHYRTDQNH